MTSLNLTKPIDWQEFYKNFTPPPSMSIWKERYERMLSTWPVTFRLYKQAPLWMQDEAIYFYYKEHTEST